MPGVPAGIPGVLVGAPTDMLRLYCSADSSRRKTLECIPSIGLVEWKRKRSEKVNMISKFSRYSLFTDNHGDDYEILSCYGTACDNDCDGDTHRLPATGQNWDPLQAGRRRQAESKRLIYYVDHHVHIRLHHAWSIDDHLSSRVV